MPQKSYSIPGSTTTIIVDCDDSGNVISVKDSHGNSGAKVDKENVKIKFHCPHLHHTVEGDFIDIPDGTAFSTHHNPNVRWIYLGGRWYLIYY